MSLQTIQNIALDIHKKSYKCLMAKQYDKNAQVVKVDCYDNGIQMVGLQNYVIEVKIACPNNKNYKLSESDGYITKDNSYVFITFPQAIFLYSGNAEIEIVIKSPTEQLSTMSFTFKIEKSVYDENEVIDDPKVKTEIEKLLEELETYQDITKSYMDNAELYQNNALIYSNNAFESEINAKKSEDNAKEYKESALNYSIDASESAVESANHANDSMDYRDVAEIYKNNALNSATSSENYAKLSESWAIGGTGIRIDEDVNNAKYYSEESYLYKEESMNYANAAKDSVNEITKKLQMATFDVDDNGNLIYTDDSAYAFSVDNNGYLNWEVE